MEPLDHELLPADVRSPVGIPRDYQPSELSGHEMLRIEHTAFSRDVFAQGALLAADWVSRQKEPKVYTMADVLGLS